MVKTCISPANNVLHAASLVLMQSSYQWSCIHLFSNMLRLCQGRPSRAKPHRCTVLLCLNSTTVGIRSDFPLWVSDLVELNHYLPGEVWKFNTSNVEKFTPVFGPTFNFQIAGGRTLQTEVETMLGRNAYFSRPKSIQNFPQRTWYKQQPSQICLVTSKTSNSGGCKTRFSRFWSTQQFYVWGTWRRIAHWSPQPPWSCELLIPHCESLTTQWFKQHWVAHRGSDPKISWSDSTRETESGSHWRGESFLWSTFLFKVLQTTARDILKITLCFSCLFVSWSF